MPSYLKLEVSATSSRLHTTFTRRLANNTKEAQIIMFGHWEREREAVFSVISCNSHTKKEAGAKSKENSYSFVTWRESTRLPFKKSEICELLRKWKLYKLRQILCHLSPLVNYRSYSVVCVKILSVKTRRHLCVSLKEFCNCNFINFVKCCL